MSKDLLNKAKLLNEKRLDSPVPKNIFSRSELPTENSSIRAIENSKRKVKTTTIRCAIETAQNINALVDVTGCQNVTELLDALVYERIAHLNPTEQNEFKVVKKITLRKNK